MDEQESGLETTAPADKSDRPTPTQVDGVGDAKTPTAPGFRATKKITNRWLSVLQQITEGATARLELQSLLQELLGRIGEAMSVDNAAILLMNADGTHLDLYAACGPEEVGAGEAQTPMGRGVVGTIAATRAPVIIDDLSKVDVEHSLLRTTARSLVGAPLVLGDRVIGVIHLGSIQPRHFVDEDSQLLQVIASRVALAIEHAQFYEAERAARRTLENLTSQLQALQTISDAALEHTQLTDLLGALLPRIQHVLQVDNVAILLPVADESELTLYSVHGPEEAVLGRVHVPMGQGVAGTIAASRKPLVVDNLATVPVSNPFLREHFCSLLGVPLLDGEQLVGVIHVDSVEPRHFTDEEIQVLRTLADRIATAIARSQQLERAQRGRAQAEQRAAALQDTVERMDEFLSLASHELRTPLTSLAMNLQFMDQWLTSERPRRANETDAEYLERAVAAVRPFVKRSGQSIKRLNRLIADLLDATYIREERLPLRPQRIDLVAVLREVVDEQRRANTTRVLTLEDEAVTPLYVDADSDRVAQVAHNYLSNALKYSSSDHPIIVTVQVVGANVRVAVHDKGVGIPLAELDYIWRRLYRVADIEHQSGSRVGLGLGLYISRDIIERHGGQVGVTSVPGEGSIFWFTLPLAPTLEAS